MSENVYEKINQALTWKRILAFNFVLFLILVIPLSVRLAQMDTENRSNAAGEDVAAAPSPVPPPNYPKLPPQVERVSMFFGKAGDTVVVLGSNFGDYQWASKVYVGNTEVQKSGVVRWSNGILEVQIPEGARTGQVWVVVNNQTAYWTGSLVLYDVSRAAQIGLKKVDATHTAIWLDKADNVSRGMVELAYVSEPITATGIGQVNVGAQSASVDMLGKKIQFTFEVGAPLPRASTEIMSVEHPSVGSIEIIRAELYDAGGRLLEIFADPLSIKVLP